jgi:inhibitor of KinA sporulation pathway (predicted exonuclease)
MTPAPRYYLVVDLEATTSDDGSLPPEQMETIEIGAVLVDAKTLDVVGAWIALGSLGSCSLDVRGVADGEV